MKHGFLFLSMAIASGLVLTNLYTSIVDVPAWGSQLPESLQHARQYYRFSNPGDFFRIFSPMNQALGLLALVLFWRSGKKTRLLLAGAFLFYVAGEAMTFQYFYPRNHILFESTLTDTKTLQRIMDEWRSMNWVRSGVIAAGVVCSAMGLHHSYRTPSRSRNRSAPIPSLTASV